MPALGLCLLAAVVAPPDPVVLPADFRARAEAYMAAQVAVNEFAGVVLVAVDGHPVFREAYGFANRDWDIPNAPDTKFRIGSVTKQFTAAAILLLEQDGELKVSDPVGRHLPDVPKAWADVTLLQLMSHTGGIPEHSPAAFPGGLAANVTPARTIALVKDKPLGFTPGEQHRYSNTGYVLLGMVVEEVGRPGYAKFLQKRIFDPLGMRDTGVERPRQVLPNRATGYVREDGRPAAPHLSMSWPFAAGAMYSTADDLLKWDQALADGRLLGPAARKTRVTAVKDGYACGVVAGKLHGRPTVWHNGRLPGSRAYLLRLPDAGLCVVVLTNHDWCRPEPIGDALAAIALGERYDLPRHVAPPPRRVGDPR